MMLTLVKPRYYISALTMGWGRTYPIHPRLLTISLTILSVTFAGPCKSFGVLLTARIFMGIFEAGIFPGCLFLIGAWYRRYDVLGRMAWFMVAFQAVAIFAVAGMWFWCRHENKQREMGRRGHLRELPEEELNQLGEKHPDFRYTT